MNNKTNDALKFTSASSFIKWVETRKRFNKKTSLDNMLYYASLFDNPQNKHKFIHITGTNGKGSTVSYVKNILIKKGLKVGTFTSPYVIKFNERISINNEYISDSDLLKYGNLILSKYDKIAQDGYDFPTFFEFLTLLALVYFSDQSDLDILIFEVGIGGRLDATNIINPLISVITNVGYDHMEQLGNTLELITKEKLGIVKPNSVFITSEKNKELKDIMKDVCKNLNTTFKEVDYESLKVLKTDIHESIFSYKGFNDFKVNMLGAHQIENATLAIEIVKALENILNKKSNFSISNEILYEGIISTFWPGRLECVNKKPLIYIDGGHNIDCIKRVCEFVKTLPYENKRVVIAISNDKEKDKMISLLDNTFNSLIFTHYTYTRSAKSIDLYNQSKTLNKLIIDDIDECVNYCLTNETDFTLFIGSLYLVSEIRPKFLNNKKN